MFLSDSCIDLSSIVADGRLPLIIFDIGKFEGDLRNKMFERKLLRLKSFIENDPPCQEDEMFEADYPGVSRKQIDIYLFWKRPPTKEMLKTHKLTLNSGLSIPIIFKNMQKEDSIRLLNPHQKKSLEEKVNKRWWQFWI